MNTKLERWKEEKFLRYFLKKEKDFLMNFNIEAYKSDDFKFYMSWFIYAINDYIDKNFNEIKKYANIIEKRIDDSWCTKEFIIKENRYNFDMCKKYDCNYVLIDNNYPIEFFL